MANANPIEKEILFTPDEFEKYFLVNLEYNINGHKWIKETILQFSLTYDGMSSEGSLLMEDMKKALENVTELSPPTSQFSLQGKLKNVHLQKHAEKILFDGLESGFFRYKARKDKKDKETTTINCGSQDLIYSVSQISINDTDKPTDKNMGLRLKLFLNYSPCADCAKLIIEFQKNVRTILDIRISIRFGSFFRFYLEKDDSRNKRGLADLKLNGISLDLIWDHESLETLIQTVGTDAERTRRKAQDHAYMNAVNQSMDAQKK